jgi:predicted nucleic acid-binding protein
MVVLIDTNVIIDTLTDREPFAKQANKILEKCARKEFDGYIAAHTITNIFYILRKKYTVHERKEMLLNLCGFVGIAGINRKQIIDTLTNDSIDDVEDCLQMECAQSIER